MNSEVIIEDMEALLSEERGAIARLDGATVARLSARKLDLARALERAPRDQRVALAGRVKELARALKHNGVLLAQASAILSEFLLGPSALLRRGAGLSIPARHLSMRV